MASRTSLQRRTFLAAIGLGIAAPLAVQMARRADAAPTGAPVRLLNIYIPNGMPWDKYNPVVGTDPLNPWAPGSLDLMAAGDSSILAPLAPWQSQFNLVRGLQIEGNKDHVATSSVLTGSPTGETDSIDFLIAQQLGVEAHVLGMSLWKAQGFGNFGHLARHGGTFVRARENPLAAADEIFAGLGAAAGTPDEAAFRAGLMDLTASQVERMQAEVKGLTSAESKLKTHLDALGNIREVSISKTLSCSDRPDMPLVQATAGLDHGDIANWRKVLDAHLELAGYAMSCSAAPVLTLHALPTSTDFIMNFEGGPGVGAPYHGGISHGDRVGLAACQRWVMERIAEVLLPILELDDPAAPGTTVLDNSIIYITSEVTDGDSHQSNSGIQYGTQGGADYEYKGTKVYNSGSIYAPYPSFLLGGGAGFLKSGGNDIVIDHGSDTGGRPHADLLATLAQAMGTGITDIGGTNRSVIEELKA